MLRNLLCFLFVFGIFTLWIYFLYLVSGPDVRANSLLLLLNSNDEIRASSLSQTFLLQERLKFPRSVADIEFLSQLLGIYLDEHFPYILLLFSSVYLYKQAFAIPGSVFLVSIT